MKGYKFVLVLAFVFALSSFAFAGVGDLRFLENCKWTTSDCDSAFSGSELNTSLALFAYNETNSHGSLVDTSGVDWRICCEGHSLTDNASQVVDAGWDSDYSTPVSYLYKEENSHVFPFDNSVFNHPARLLSVLGNDFEVDLFNSSVYDLNNAPSGAGWVPLASFAGRSHSGDEDGDGLVFDSHIASPRKVWNSGLEGDYQKTLWVRSGIPMLCGEEVEDPNGIGTFGPACNDSVTDSSGDPVSEFCDDSSDCVALNHSTDEAQCFDYNETFDVDDLRTDGDEVCSKANHWCPEGYKYLASEDKCTLKGDEEACYDEPCDELEKESSTTSLQRGEWLLDRDDCSYSMKFDSERRSCCLDYVIYDDSGEVEDAKQTDQVVKVYPGGGKDPVCVDENGEETNCNN